MLPNEIVEFLHGTQVFSVGTRSASLRPALARPLGVFADGAKDLVSLYLPVAQTGPHLANIADNGWVALVSADAVSHTSYQLKGHVTETRPSTPADAAIRDVYRDKMIVFFRQYFFPMPDNFYGDFIADPSTTITFRVEKIFNQTPGPGAGRAVEFTPSEI